MPELRNKASLAQRGIDKEFNGRIQRIKPLLRPLLRNAGGTLEVVEIHELTPQK
jgi:Fe-S cluster biogenesis protein NfuA